MSPPAVRLPCTRKHSTSKRQPNVMGVPRGGFPSRSPLFVSGDGGAAGGAGAGGPPRDRERGGLAGAPVGRNALPVSDRLGRR